MKKKRRMKIIHFVLIAAALCDAAVCFVAHRRNHNSPVFVHQSALQQNSQITSPRQEDAEWVGDPMLDSAKNLVNPSTIEAAKRYPAASGSSGLLPGRHKFLGGAKDNRDGVIYGIPSHAGSVVCLYPSEEQSYRIRTVPLPLSASGGKFKWLRAILANGYLYGIPSWANSVLEVDVDRMWGRRNKVSSGSNLVRLISLPDGHTANSTWQWHGAALNANRTAIYAVPSNSDKVLKVDLMTHTASFIDIRVPDKYSNFQLNHTNKWYGAILGQDDAVYGIPYRTCATLRIDCERDTAALVGPDFGCQLYNWHGGIQVDGSIYAFPSHASTVLKIDTTKESKGRNCTLLPIHGADNDTDTVDRYKWLGGGLGADGNIYGMPCDASSILKIDVSNERCSTFGSTGKEKKKWQGAVLARDGSLYAIPSYGRHILRIDTRPNGHNKENLFQMLGDLPCGKDKWQGAFIGNDGIMYALPENGYRILRVTPPAGHGDDFFASDVKIDML